MSCKCIEKIQEHNGIEISVSINLMKGLVWPLIEYRKKGEKKYSRTLIPTFCPFCAARYEKQPKATT